MHLPGASPQPLVATRRVFLSPTLSPLPPAPILILTQGLAGDRLGARLAPALRRTFPDRDLLGIGGLSMRAAGVGLVARTDTISAMGYTGLLPQLPATLAAVFRTALGTRHPLPAAVVAVDVWQPLAALRRFAPHLRVLPHVCYLPPGPNFVGPTRVHDRVARMFSSVVTPFAHQERLFREAGASVRRGGHAGLQAGLEEASPLSAASRLPLLALLPGSRALEVRHGLEVQLAAARQLAEFGLEPVVCCAGEAIERLVRARFPGLRTERNARAILARARFALICSGTAALEAAVFGCPGVVTYHVSALQRWEWRTFHVQRLARLRAAGIASPWVSLPNIIAGRELYPELLDEPADRIAAAARRALSGDPTAARAALDAVTASLSWDDAGQVVAEEVARALEKRAP